MTFAVADGFLAPTAIKTTNLLAPAQWAQLEFALAKLGDQRRPQRLVNMAACLAQTPTGTLPQAFPEWKDLKATCRFLDHLEYGPAEIQQPHRENTLAACRQPGEYLLIEDTTELDYSSHPKTKPLGFIGNGQGQGLLVHSTLAVRVEAWNLAQEPEGIALGLLAQKSWVRPVKGLRQQSWRKRMSRPRESDRWARALAEMGVPPAGCQWIYLADREAGFYEPIQRCQQQGLDFIIRGYHDHKQVGADEHLSAA
jgi:hypothetical protein